MDSKRDTRVRAALAVQSVQRKFYCRQPVVVRGWTARLGGPRLGHVHARNQTPSVAVLWIGLATAACMFLGDAVLVPFPKWARWLPRSDGWRLARRTIAWVRHWANVSSLWWA